MSRSNTIRKKAQDLVKKRDWEGAIKEYRHLVELDQSNPNIYNELGDLYLKTNQKAEAMKSFESAVEAYSRVGLFNNAVAVCKKLLRLQSTNNEIIAKLGNLRKKQGLLKEAISYYMSYLEKIVLEVNLEPQEMKKKLVTVANEMSESPEVLEKTADYLFKWEFKEEGAKVLGNLLQFYEKREMAEQAKDVRERIEELGLSADSITEKPPQASEDVVQSEEELWTKAPPTEGDQIGAGQEKSAAPPPKPPREPLVESPVSGAESAPASGGTSAQDFGVVDIDKPLSETSTAATNPSLSSESTTDVQTAQAPQKEAQGDIISGGKTLSDEDVWIPKSEIPDPLASNTDSEEGKVVHVSQIIDEFKSEIKESVDEEDHRSHYDLGMAYLEMDFLPEAIKEFQFAAKSEAYMVKSLEMIGMCFISQNQPGLAIKQLLKGLEAVGDSDRETLGLKYNLGLAYEMAGDSEKAKGCFEDVYVIDVTFREVAEKVKKYSG